MSFFNAYQLLTEAAYEYQHQRETFSTVEIVARINEIKYLSSQKKVPKLSLRKEIIHLENKLATVVELEQRMARRTRQDSAKEKSLKKQIKGLQNRLAMAEDKDLQKKLDQLSQLLGDYLAKKTTEEEVQAAIAEIKLVKVEKAKLIPTLIAATSEKNKQKLSPLTVTDESSPQPPAEIQEKVVQPRILQLQQRLELLKGELELLKILKKDSRAQGVAEKIAFLEQKLNEYGKPAEAPLEPAAAKPDVVVEKPEIKHTLLFSPPAEKKTELMTKKSPPKITDEDLELENELPLPPPPKMKR